MATCTNGILTKGTSIVDIEKALRNKLGNESIIGLYGYQFDFLHIVFLEDINIPDSHRNMAVSFSNACESDYGIPGVWISLGRYGKSIEIIKYLCETFGGYLHENDCNKNKPYYLINPDLYLNGKESTEKDLFINKIITTLGFDKLKKTLELFEEFKTIK